MKSFSPIRIQEAAARIAPHLNRTPLLTSSLLNSWLGHQIIFKAESFQKIGAFKARGALNALLARREKGKLPEEVVAFSSGNHAQAVAWSAAQLGIRATIVMPSTVSNVKLQATKSYGAEVILTATRQEAEMRTAELVAQGMALIHPYDHDDVIAGQGTACLEALQDGAKPDAIFAPCGGGGLLSGTFLAAKLLAPNALVFGVEPALANDASQSYRSGKIVALPETPATLADGVRTLSVAARTFYYLKQLDGFYEIAESDIIYWTQWLTHLLKTAIEPTSALGMAAATAWLSTQSSPKRVLIILSGGNIDQPTQAILWRENKLLSLPSL